MTEVQRYDAKAKKNTKCAKVKLLDGNEKDFYVEKNSKGGALFNDVCVYLDLIERSYFGLIYKDGKNNDIWLVYDVAIAKQLKGRAWKFELHVQFYPPNPNALHEELTRYYICLQLRQDIVSGRLPCSYGVYSLLGAYVIQSELGDFNIDNHHGLDYMKAVTFTRKNIQNSELLQRISDLHKSLRGLSPEEADYIFLTNARKMSLYGIEMHKVLNVRDNEYLLMGVCWNGIIIHKGFIRSLKIIWPKILKICYKRAFLKIVYKHFAPKTEIIKFQCASQKMARKLWLRCVESHIFFRMRDIEPSKKKNLLKKETYFNVKLTYYQMQNSLIERTPPQIKRNTVLDNFTLPESGSINIHEKVESIPEEENFTIDRITFEFIKIRFSYVDQSDTVIFISDSDDAADYVHLSKNLDDNDVEWKGARTNYGIFLDLHKTYETENIIYFESHIITPGVAKFGWATDNFDFKDAEKLQYSKYSVSHNENVCFLVTSNYGPILSKDDVISTYFDLKKLKIWWQRNNSSINDEILLPSNCVEKCWFPIILLKSGSYRISFKSASDDEYLNEEGEYVVGLADVAVEYLRPNRNIEWQIRPRLDMNVYLNGQIIQSRLNNCWEGFRANKGIKSHSGRYYYEVTQVEAGSYCLAMIGWTTSENDDFEIGADPNSWGYGADRDGFGLNGNQGKKMNNDDIENYGKAFGQGDVIGCFIDFYESTLSWSLNGIWFGVAYCFESAVRVSDDGIDDVAFYPAFYLKNSSLKVNFGYTDFAHSPKVKNKEFIPLCQVPLQFTKYNLLANFTDKAYSFEFSPVAYVMPEEILNCKYNSSQNNKNAKTCSLKKLLENEIYSQCEPVYEDCSETDDDLIDFNHIPTIQTKAIRFVPQDDPIIEEITSDKVDDDDDDDDEGHDEHDGADGVDGVDGVDDNEGSNVEIDDGAQNGENELPIILTKTSYFQYGGGDNSFASEEQPKFEDRLIDTSSTNEDELEKRLTELTGSIHRRSSGAEGGNVKEVTMA